VVLVEDEEIVRAQKTLWDAFRLFVEPGSAAFAALLAGRYQPAPDEHVAVVLCGETRNARHDVRRTALL
jgi:threonine dehydratase